MLAIQSMKLLRHIFRIDKYDPLKQAIFEIGTTSSKAKYCGRVSKPRAGWLLGRQIIARIPARIPSDLYFI